MGRIDGVLLDIDGTLVVSWEAIPGAADTLAWLRAEDVPFRLITNTTSRARSAMARQLQDAGLHVEPEEIISAVVGTASYLRVHHPGARVFVLNDGDASEDLDGVDLVEEDADVVVIGGGGDLFSYEAMNRIFRMVTGGATLVGMHRSMYWQTTEGLKLDGGSYLAALEAAAGVAAAVCGKPAPAFFEGAVRMIGTEAPRTMMVGDDIVNDVLAAQAVGLSGALVRTGKFRPEDLERGSGRPDHVIGSIADLPSLLRPA